MRVTAQTKNRTRERILAVARRLFARKGFEQTTTRDLASAVGLAAGALVAVAVGAATCVGVAVGAALPQAAAKSIARAAHAPNQRAYRDLKRAAMGPPSGLPHWGLV